MSDYRPDPTDVSVPRQEVPDDVPAFAWHFANWINVATYEGLEVEESTFDTTLYANADEATSVALVRFRHCAGWFHVYAEGDRVVAAAVAPGEGPTR